ncbi:MAG: hypothetical protein H0S80_14220 [Desulfovibrionaceae bacterium]|nr:hypothetical protein [Desulfovibrionaceae bacterium]
MIATVFSSLAGMAQSSKDSGRLEKERAAREAEQAKQEADDRKRDRAKVVEARELEEKSKRNSMLSQGSASLVEEPQTAATGLKQKLGE